MYSFLKLYFFSYFHFHIFKVQVFFNTFSVKTIQQKVKLEVLKRTLRKRSQSAKVRPKDALQKPWIPKQFLKVLDSKQSLRGRIVKLRTHATPWNLGHKVAAISPLAIKTSLTENACWAKGFLAQTTLLFKQSRTKNLSLGKAQDFQTHFPHAETLIIGITVLTCQKINFLV